MENFCKENLKLSSKKWVIASVYPKFRRNLCLRSTNADLYSYGVNNPVRYIDPDGNSTEVSLDEDGNYIVTGGCADEDRNIYIMKDGVRSGEVLGQSLTSYSFLDDYNNPVLGAKISLNDDSGEVFLTNFKTRRPMVLYYMFNGRNGKKYDFKDLGIDSYLSSVEKDKYRYRGMIITDNSGNKVFASARDIGNYAAGYIASICGFLPWKWARAGFDCYNGSPEPPVTQRAQWEGHEAGLRQNNINCKQVQERIQSHH